jgi:hypothetical protein
MYTWLLSSVDQTVYEYIFLSMNILADRNVRDMLLYINGLWHCEYTHFETKRVGWC